jgi:uncharacterized protein YjbI with pentapeptide repeats
MLEARVTVAVLSKLLQAGMAAWDAFKEEGISSKESTAIRLATDLLGDLGGKSSGQLSDMAALHFGVVTQCFGHALGRQWAFNRQLAPHGLRLFMNKEQRKRADEIDLRVKLAVSALPKFGGPSLLQAGDLPASAEGVRDAAVIGEPLATPYYRALWEAFSNPKLDEGDEARVPLLDLEKGRLGFERDFLLAYQQVLASPEGQKLQRYVAGLAGDYRARMLRELRLRDMAEWGERHTFGNVERHDRPADDPIPFMPLAKMYIEPDARLAKKERQEEEPRRPVLSLIEHWLGASKTNVVVVRADFGMGKSLTARSLAQRLALRFLETRTPSPEMEIPVFIQCAEDLTEEGFDLGAFVRRAWKREAGELELKLKLDDPALEPPGRTQRALFIFDGLDEVILGERRLESFFQRIKDEASAHHRFIVFSRPGALPPEQSLEGIPVLEILPWAEPQIADWLEAWRGLSGGAGPTSQELVSRGLVELAKTPILLFMVAQTWKDQSHGVGASLAALYEEFFWQIARGKHEADLKSHKNVSDASKQLHQHLMRTGVLTQETHPPDAMLWLMGRVAWESTKLDQRQMLEPFRRADVLTKHGITNLLIDELKMERSADETIDAIQMGLLLTLQAHFRAQAASQLLFGHKSFREFLVARYWADRLKAIARAPAQDWEQFEAPLLGGRLLSREDRTFEFLMEMLNGAAHPKRSAAPFGLMEPERHSLLGWAQMRFKSEEPLPDESARGVRGRRHPSLREDRSPWLREAALAIGSTLKDSPGLRQDDKLTMRSMLAWFWLMRIGPVVVARKAYLPGAVIPDNSIPGADFSEANLEEANFSRADLRPRGISGSLIQPASFSRAVLDRAAMMNADLSMCLFGEASLVDANLSRAVTNSAYFGRANLRGAVLELVRAANAVFDNADLTDSQLLGAFLRKASFVGANLTGANLMGANLMGANLESAHLQGANFERANFEGASLRGASYDATTRGPEGFDPDAAGAVRVRS